MIRKTLILGLIVIVIVLLALPLAVSFRLSKYESLYVTRLSQSQWFNVENVDFSRGWFSSHSRIILAPRHLPCSPTCPKIQIDSTIYHGPLPFGAFADENVPTQLALGVVSSRVHFKDAVTADLTPPLPPLHVTSIIHLAGNQAVSLNLPASRHKVMTGHGTYKLTINAVDGSARIDQQGRLQRARLSTPGFNLKDTVDNAVIAQAHNAEVHIERSDNGAVDFTQSLERLSLHGAGSVAFNLEMLRVKSHSRRQNGLVSGSLDAGFRKLSTLSRTYGPATLRLRVARINTRALQRLNAGLTNLVSTRTPSALSIIGALTVYQNNAAALLRPGPEIDIRRAALGTSKGQLQGSLDISIPPSKNAEAPGPYALLGRLRVAGKVRMPKPLMRALMRRRLIFDGYESPPPEQVDQAIDNLLSRGVIKPAPNANAYILKLRLKHGQLTLNGQSSTAWKELVSLMRNIVRGNSLLRVQPLSQGRQNEAPARPPLQ